MSDHQSDDALTGAIGRQRDVYLQGIAGYRPTVPVDYATLEKSAAAFMSAESYAYVACGAGNERTIDHNQKAFDRWRIVPRMLRDVSQLDTSIELFGKKLPSPILLCPIGVSEMAHKDADLAAARACAREGVPMIFSNQASKPMEACAAEMGDSPRWFQLYWSKSNDLVRSLVQRAERCGCDAIVVTLDTTMLGWRTRDLDLAYLPFLRGKGIAQYTSDPVFIESLKSMPEGGAARPPINLNTLKTVAQQIANYPGNPLQGLSSGNARAAVQQFISVYSKPDLTWDDLSFLRTVTNLPIVLKGILHPDDAREAVKRGIDGMIVSNHGGRQVDGAIASLDALPPIVDAVGNKIPVLFDSGIRGGAHVFKALALGATAVGLGRPWVYGLAINGETGVREVLQNIKVDFELTMGLSGCRNIVDITRQSLVREEG